MLATFLLASMHSASNISTIVKDQYLYGAYSLLLQEEALKREKHQKGKAKKILLGMQSRRQIKKFSSAHFGTVLIRTGILLSF